LSKSRHTRTRVIAPRSRNGTVYTTSFGVKTGLTGKSDFSGKQVTVSEGHHWPPPQGAPLSDRGGPFHTTKSYIEGNCFTSGKAERVVNSNLRYDYNGYFAACQPPVVSGSVFPLSPASSDAALAALGTTAIARCEPTNSVADASTFLGEMVKDGLPSLPGIKTWQTKADVLVRAGDEFLNAAFGWAPLVADAKKFATAAEHASTVLAQYERDAGRVVRRRYNFPTVRDPVTTTTISTNHAALYAGGVTNVLSNATVTPRGTLTRTVETVRDQWFSGAFTYYIPSNNDSWKKLMGYGGEAQKLLGTSLTPDVLWELAPWSWAVDWFSNAGDVIHNMSAVASQGLVLRYGYMMEHSIRKYTYAISGSHGINGAPGLKVPPLTLVTESKKRIPAGPFGFGVTWDGMSPFQAAIAAALAITRVG
jgi:hypothetical protein